MQDLITDPWFFAAAVPSVILVGLGKGGFGGAMALIGVPVMALVMSPVQAAAILLPILIVMDIVSLWSWRGTYDRTTLAYLLPGGLLGIAVGWATAAFVTVAMVRLIVGAVAMVFFLRWLTLRFQGTDADARPQSAWRGTLWGAVSGFTSFVAHAGGPPYQVYAMPLRHPPGLYAGTAVIFFAIINAVKLVPYFALGQFDTTNLTASAVLMPIAALATLVGAWVVRRMKPEFFYNFMYALVFLVAAKLIYDGVTDLLG
jgi:uncharacterized membrane protein YfcA